MTTSNLKAVPIREFGDMDAIADSLIVDMHGELTDELKVLRADLRELGARRNGLARVEAEIMLRELEL